MAYDLVDAVLTSGASLPSPGIALIRLQAAIQDDNAGVREFANAVAADPAVCGALMRVANSAVFHPPHKSETIEQAISSIGASRTMAVTASVCLKGQLELLKGDLRPLVEKIFAAANQAAELSFLVARGGSLRRLSDMAYLGAMMQDAGVIVQAKRGDPVTPESADTDNGHPALGAAVLRNWKMPAIIASAVGTHHNANEAAKLGGDIHALACLMAAGRRLRDGESEEWTAHWATPAQEKYGIDSAYLEAILAKLAEKD